MNAKKNEARLQHKGQEFVIYQDDKDNWRFTFGNLLDVNTMHKELQLALNEVYASIEEKMPNAVFHHRRGVRINPPVVKHLKRKHVVARNLR